MTPLALFLVSLAVAAAIVTCLWVASIPLRDVSIVDIAWGLLFVAMAGVGLIAGDGDPLRRAVLFVITGVWGLRLAVHLGRRNIGHDEDRRYAAMRRARGPSFVWTSLGTVFLLQAVLAAIIALPLHAGGGIAGAAFGGLGIAGAIVAVSGITIEAIADHQLAVFKRTRDAGQHGVLDTGLWRYSRHPNYFGDAVVWWGIGAIGVETGAWYALVGPLLMTILLLKVSGVSLLEKTITARRPAYEAYVRRTSAFVPWPPRGS